MFPCNRWLTGDEDRRVEVEVYPGMVNVITVKLIRLVICSIAIVLLINLLFCEVVLNFHNFKVALNSSHRIF